MHVWGGWSEEVPTPSKRSSRSSAEALKRVWGTSGTLKRFQGGRIASVAFLLVGGGVLRWRISPLQERFSVSGGCGKLEGVPPLMIGAPDTSIFITISF